MTTLERLAKLKIAYDSLKLQYAEMERAYKKIIKKKDKQLEEMQNSNTRIVMNLLQKLSKESLE